MITRVLAALDRSERAERVLRCAVDVADSLSASLYLLRAVPLELLASPRLQAEAQLRTFAARTPHLHVETIVRISIRPWRAIVDVADEIDAHMIVVGSHGYRGIDYVVGTTTGRVADLASCSVFVVHCDPEPPLVGSYRQRPRRP